ncbi:MAG TPA: diacylglycerol kinase family protein [Burkholderiales bacterium]|nr:diacylglycerol kinase family protein [Burkholderiales bacterium]
MPPPALSIVLNGRSGKRGRGGVRAELERALRERGATYEIVEPRRRRDIAAVAAQAAARAAACGGTVVAAGGDGTLNAVAHAAYQAGCRFGAIPLGTFNYFAREHGLPLEPAAAAAALRDGVEAGVQVGLVNERLFLVNASVGLYPQLLEDREAFKAQYGRTRWVALLAAAWTLGTRSQPRIAVRIATGAESRPVRVSTLFVGNNPLQLERLGLREAQAVEAGRLAAIRVRPGTLWGLVKVLLHGAVGRLGEADGVEAFSFREMEVAPLKPARRPVVLNVATDGERTRMALPLVFRVAPRPLRLVRPAP